MVTATPLAPERHSRFMVDIALEIQRKGTLGFFESTWRRQGDQARVQMGPRRLYLVVHPDHVQRVTVGERDKYGKGPSYEVARQLIIGDGLVGSTGALWRRQRKLMAPFFTPRAVETYLPLITEDGLRFRARWDAAARRGKPVEMLHEMAVLTASIILRSMFSTENPDDIERVKRGVETMIGFVEKRSLAPLHAPLWLPTPNNRAYQEARVLVDTYIHGVIARRRAMDQEAWPDDLLTRLMRTRDEETGAPMSDTLLRDEAVTIFVAGHETTARTLAFLWYSLDRHPAVAARLHAELDAVLGDELPTLAHLKRLPYTLRVIKETLRLFPAAPIYGRDVLTDDTIDGVPVSVGSYILILPYLTHRHPDFWPDPERFDPDRWEPDRERSRHPYAYHPFAAGPRICIGNNFSLFETHLLVALLARHFAPRMVPGHTPQVWLSGALTSRNGLPMLLAHRDAAPAGRG